MQRGNPSYFDNAITKIQSDISRMETISAEFLDYARGEIRLKMSVCDVGELLERFRESMSLKATALGVSIYLENTAKEQVALDEDRMLRVLVNIGENACKAMPLGGTIQIRSWIEAERLLINLHLFQIIL